MLEVYGNPQSLELSNDEIKEEIGLLRKRLEMQQMLIKEKKLPVFVLFEGWGASGKGSLIKKIIRNIDPRFFSVAVMETELSEKERRMPFLYRFMKAIPEAGKLAFLDSGWMGQVIRERFAGALSNQEYEKRIDSIKTFERQLTDNGYLVLKIFLNISETEQKKRLKKLEEDEETSWRVNHEDRWQNKHYEECKAVFDAYLKATNTSNAPWYIVDSEDKKKAELQALRTMTTAIDTALENCNIAVPLLQNTFQMVTMPKLSEVNLNPAISEKEYKKQLDEKQALLETLHNRLYLQRVPVVIVYEGWDAGGKGGNIRRVTEALDPRGYDVVPIASPEPHEKNRMYLWRFWTQLQKNGHITIFDRSWYGRVMVERIEGFCSKNDWQRAYNEINEFEKELVEWGAVVIKFWIHIDSETQLARFTERQNTPEKQWKITDEDWRNRDKWQEYEAAVDEMLKRTSTANAPWHIIESNDKKYARIKTLKIIIKEIEKRLS